MTRAARLGALAGLALALAPGSLASQDLAARVRAAGAGTVTFRYRVRPGVEVCEDGVRTDGGGVRWGHGHTGAPERCSRGEAEVVVRTAGGRVSSLELLPAGSAPSGAADLGPVGGGEAVAFLLGLARTGAGADAARDALPAAALAEGAEAWPGMLELAKDRALPEKVRTGALFWVGQAAADVVTPNLAAIAGDAGEDQAVKDAAIFALSRRPDGEGVAALMEIALTAGEAGSRRSALFWLARSEDPRVVPFFEAILSGRTP